MSAAVAKVPQVQGKALESMALFTEVIPPNKEWGWEKFCIWQNFPGFPSLGMILSSDV
jgi:hypothetical protein